MVSKELWKYVWRILLRDFVMGVRFVESLFHRYGFSRRRLDFGIGVPAWNSPRGYRASVTAAIYTLTRWPRR